MHLTKALRTFSTATNVVLKELQLALTNVDKEQDYRDINETAAELIFKAWSQYASDSLEIFSGFFASATTVIETQAAGEAILQFAASAFLQISGQKVFPIGKGRKLIQLVDTQRQANT